MKHAEGNTSSKKIWWQHALLLQYKKSKKLGYEDRYTPRKEQTFAKRMQKEIY